MKTKTDRIKNLTDNFAVLLEREQQTCYGLASSVQASIKALQGDTADRRLQNPSSQLKKLQERLNGLAKTAQRDFFVKIEREVEDLQQALDYSPAGAVLTSLFDLKQSSLSHFCALLLDGLIKAAGAERGFVLRYMPESTEAEVVAARSYKTRNILVEEYNFSRTLLKEALQRCEPLLVEDALNDPAFSMESSVKEFGIRSVVAVPLKQSGRIVGALYLENNKIPRAFDEEDQQLLERGAQFTVFYLENARLLPAVTDSDNRTFLDVNRAPRGIVGNDPKILELLEMISRIADTPATVLIEGESGTGKELVARELHLQSSRRNCPFVPINCAAIPENLLESELFGHEKGAYTSASTRYIGLIEQANGGTIFLDEISEMAFSLQAKLLRFLQPREIQQGELQPYEFHRLGSKETTRVNVRVVAATSKDLKVMVEAGKFQDALYYRLNVILLQVPALRERKEDIPLLAERFVNKYATIYKKSVQVGRGVYEMLKEYPFPGNVRELENLIHRLVALSSDGSIRIGDLPKEIQQVNYERFSLEKDPLYRILHTPPIDFEDLRRRKEEIKRVLAEQEQELAKRLVDEAGGSVTEAARKAGVHRVTLHNLLK